MAVEADPERLAAQSHLEPGALAVECGGEIVEVQTQVDRLVTPYEPAGRDEALGDRRPGERHLDVGEALQKPPRVVANFDRAVGDADFRERHQRVGWAHRWFERAVTWLSIHLWDRPRGFAEVRRVADSWTIATFEPAHFHRYYLNEFFPSVRQFDLARFPDGPALERELRDAGFDDVRLVLFSQRAEISREAVLARIEGRHISTFDLLQEEEIRAGTERARRELPKRVEYGLDWLVAVAA